MDKVSPRLEVAAGVLLVLCAGLLLFIIHDAQERARASRDWPQTTCTILVSDKRETKGRHAEYWIEIEYTYSVGGQRYYGDRIDPLKNDGQSGAPDKRDVLARRYPVGARVSCWYDPANPDYAILERSAAPELLWIVLIGVMGMAGVYALVHGSHRLRKSRAR